MRPAPRRMQVEHWDNAVEQGLVAGHAKRDGHLQPFIRAAISPLGLV